jgi:hypothetical protein
MLAVEDECITRSRNLGGGSAETYELSFLDLLHRMMWMLLLLLLLLLL